MLLICGTVPLIDLGLTLGEAKFDGEKLFINDCEIPCTQGTAALISAACVTASYCKTSAPRVAVAGDNGSGKGSRLLYDYLIQNLPSVSPGILLLHYILPVMGLMKKVCAAAEKCTAKPVMIADASSMYAAKAAGLAPLFDIFTPDLCEMAFLADATAAHPAYISHHLFSSEIPLPCTRPRPRDLRLFSTSSRRIFVKWLFWLMPMPSIRLISAVTSLVRKSRRLRS